MWTVLARTVLPRLAVLQPEGMRPENFSVSFPRTRTQRIAFTASDYSACRRSERIAGLYIVG